MEFDYWVCLDAGEDDYVIDRFEVRVKGKKPLVLNKPSYSKLVFIRRKVEAQLREESSLDVKLSPNH